MKTNIETLLETSDYPIYRSTKREEAEDKKQESLKDELCHLVETNRLKNSGREEDITSESDDMWI